MKKLILKFLNNIGYQLITADQFNDLWRSRGKLPEVLTEHYYLSRKSGLSDLPATIPAKTGESLERLIGTSPYEGLSIYNALLQTKVEPGDICEFGIAQGATSRLIASVILEHALSKNLILIDSFQGLSAPTAEDELKDDIFKLGSINKYAGSMAYESAEVLKRLKEISFPESRVRIIPGFIEESIKRYEYPQSVSFAYVDFDLYQPIKTALDYLKNTLSAGGIIIVDDYDFFSTGAKKAVDLFVEENNESFQLQIPDKELGHFCILSRV